MPFTIGNYVRKSLSTPQGFLRGAALLLATAAVGGGVIFGFGVSRPNPSSLATTTDENIAANFTAVETQQGCVGSGVSTATGCVQIISGVTNQHFIFTKSGGIITGDFATPNFVLSGTLLRIGGGYPVAGQEFTVVGDMSGSTLTVSGVGGAAGRIPCFKAGGVLGYQVVTATGTLTAGGCQ